MSIKTARNLVERLMNEYQYSTACIAKQIGVSQKTIDRIRQGLNPSLRTEINLIRFYCLCTINFYQHSSLNY